MTLVQFRNTPSNKNSKWNLCNCASQLPTLSQLTNDHPSYSTKVDNKPFTTLNFTDLGSPFGGPNEDPPGTPTMSGEAHIGPPTPHESNNSTPVSKSAFIELQQHGYAPLRTSYQHHFNTQPGNAHSGPTATHETGFPSPRGALGAYAFPPMHQNSYTGYHLGSYASNCPPSPKDDGKFSANGLVY